jgi:NTP pyrophosphatase (non-canonical NTP hydrolase)
MDFKEYQEKSRKTALYPNVGSNFVYPTLGLSGEAGEVAEKIKKVLRDKNGIIDEETKDSIKKELGDVLWYISQIATELNISLDDIAENNIKKLASRMERNMLKGSGDNR